MQITSVRTYSQRDREISQQWLLELLSTPTLTSLRTMPSTLRCTIMVNGRPTYVTGGTWAYGDDYFYVGADSRNIGLLDRLAAIAAIAAVTGFGSDEKVANKIQEALCTVIQDGVKTVYSNLVASTAKPTRLAVNINTAQVAAMLDGKWYLTGGAPIEVDDSWTTMDF